MPLDGHSYLVSQGWGGKGTGLREGAISRPLAIAQKKNLAGLGKDRDEAFPFWDHLFSAAAKSIVVKCLSDDEDDTESSSSNEVTIKRTSTGIFSTRRPVEGTPANSGTATPNDSSANPGLSLLTNAKRDAARRGLYSRFFKGPVLGPESIAEEEKRLAALVSEAFAKQNPGVESIKVTEHIEIQMGTERVSVDLEVSKSHKKRMYKATERSDNDEESEAVKRERKRQRREKKRARMGENVGTKKASRKDAQVDKKKSNKSKSQSKTEESDPGPSKPTQRAEADDGDKESKSERKLKKAEKSKSKTSRKGENATTADHADVLQEEEKHHRSKSKSNDKKEKKSLNESSRATAEEATTNPKTEGKRKKKRKRTHTSDDEE